MRGERFHRLRRKIIMNWSHRDLRQDDILFNGKFFLTLLFLLTLAFDFGDSLKTTKSSQFSIVGFAVSMVICNACFSWHKTFRDTSAMRRRVLRWGRTMFLVGLIFLASSGLRYIIDYYMSRQLHMYFIMYLILIPIAILYVSMSVIAIEIASETIVEIVQYLYRYKDRF